MAIAASIGDFLERERIAYRTIAHPVAYIAPVKLLEPRSEAPG